MLIQNFVFQIIKRTINFSYMFLIRKIENIDNINIS